MKKILLASLIVFGLASAYAHPVTAQGDLQQGGRAALEAAGPLVKEFGRPGYPKITVYVWGSANSGIWRVERGVDLLSFASAVSQVGGGDNRPGQRVDYYLNLYRKGQTNEAPFFRSKFEQLIAGRSDLPALEEGDVLIVQQQTRQTFTWRDIAQVTGTLAAVVSSVLLVLRIGRGEVF
jgi:hypothetical protein